VHAFRRRELFGPLGKKLASRFFAVKIGSNHFGDKIRFFILGALKSQAGMHHSRVHFSGISHFAFDLGNLVVDIDETDGNEFARHKIEGFHLKTAEADIQGKADDLGLYFPCAVELTVGHWDMYLHPGEFTSVR